MSKANHNLNRLLDKPVGSVESSFIRHAVYIITHRQPPPDTPPSLNEMIRMVAGFGGFLNRKQDGFPGAETLWIGLTRCHDFVIARQAQRAALNTSYG